MTRWLAAAAWLAGCDAFGTPSPTTTADTATNPDADTDTDADSDSDTDTDADADSDTDADTDADPTAIRVVHVSPDLPDQDMVVNANLPPVMQALAFEDGTIYSERPSNLYTFQFKDAGSPLADAWITFDYQLQVERRHSFVIYGPALAAGVLRLLDDDLAIAPDKVRIRWTHVAPALPSPVDVYDTIAGVPITLGLTYADSLEVDLDPVETQVGLDVDGDGAVDLVFGSFERSGGEYFHVLITNEADGTPFLLGETTDGATPRRDLVP